MRPAFIIAAGFACASLLVAGGALAAQDRFGPPRPASEAPAAPASAYSGRMLTWSSRRLPPPAPAAAAPTSRPVAASPVAAFALRGATPPAPSLALGPPATASLYDRGPQLAGGPPAQRIAAAAPTPPRALGPQAHYYSLHREYGLTPDAIPAPPTGARYVLIGPSDARATAPAASGQGANGQGVQTDPDSDDRPF